MTPSTRFLKWLIRHRHWLLAVGIGMGIATAWVGTRLELDRSIERLFAEDDPLLVPYRQLMETFGEHQIVLAVYQDAHLADESQIACVAELADAAREIPGIAAVVSMVDVPGLVSADGTALRTDERAERLMRVFSGFTHNAAFDAAGIVCLMERFPGSPREEQETLAHLESLIGSYPGGALVGEPVLVREAFDMLEADGQRLNTWCLALLLLTLWACFRQLRWIVLPLLVVQVALSMTRALLVMLNLQLSMVSSMLAAIVTVVGVATVVHLIVRYRDQRLEGRSPRQALLRAGGVLLAPVFFACLTDAVGFAALMTSSVKPVQDFGLMMAIGSLMVLVAIPFVAPGVVLFRGDRSYDTKAGGHHRLQHALREVYLWSCRHSRAVLVGIALVTVGALAGNAQLIQETDFTRNFREGSDIVRGYRFVDDHFGGAGVWDIAIPAPRQLDQDFLNEVLTFQEDLQQQAPELTKVLSLADILEAGIGDFEELPLGGELAIQAALRLMRGRMPEFVAAIHDAEAARGDLAYRIMLRAPERLEAEAKNRLIEQVRATTSETYPQAEVTGYYVLLARLIDTLLRDQWTTFAVAIAGILVTMAFAFRSLPLAIVAILPNVLPVIWLFGAMGWLGVKINMGAAMIAAVSLGLSVDGSIHYVMNYLRLRREGQTLEDAIEAVQSTVGRAAVFATLALVVGFSTLATSDFVPTIYFGTLVSLSMVGGLVGNLVLLPLLIRRLGR